MFFTHLNIGLGFYIHVKSVQKDPSCTQNPSCLLYEDSQKLAQHSQQALHANVNVSSPVACPGYICFHL